MVLWIFLLSVLFLWLYWGNTSIRTTQVGIADKKIPASFSGFRIVQISDLHNAEFGKHQGRLLKAVRDASPDLIAVTGDLIDSRHTNLEEAMEFVRGAVRIAPVYYVTGNHEARLGRYAFFKNKMEEAGVSILKNTGATISRGGSCIRLLGLEDPAFSKPHGTNAENAALLDARLKAMRSAGNAYTVLLSHRPEQLDVYTANGTDLALCGHAHGGQIRLPFIGGLFAPNQGFFPKYTAGVHQKGRTKMVVSRGLGNSLAPLRINNRPELVVLTLTR